MSSNIVAFCRVWVRRWVQKPLPYIVRALAFTVMAVLMLSMAAYLVALIGSGIWTADFMP
jgi:hypothetical protein